MAQIDQAKHVLTALGLPERQTGDLAALTILAFADLGPAAAWIDAQKPRLRIHDVILFAAREFDREYAENTRETIRRQAVHQFVQAGILVRNPDAPGLATNSPNTHYALTEEAVGVLRSFGTASFRASVASFRPSQSGGLAAMYAKERVLERVPVQLPDGTSVSLSPGPHNELQRAILEDFAGLFVPGGLLLYLGDADDKHLVHQGRSLAEIGIDADVHGKLPDVLIRDPRRDWVFLCEAVTSHGPVSAKRHIELEDALRACELPRIYVSCFLTFGEYKRHADEIAWETEVWIAERPTHLLHYDGEHFLAPEA